MDARESLTSLLTTAEKLVHSLAEVRRRAVQSLDFKLKHHLLSHGDLAKERAVLKNLLGCLRHEDNGVPTDAAVLMLVAKAASAPAAARQLLHLGAEELLGELLRSRAPELHATVQHARAAILAAVAPSASAASTPAVLLAHVPSRPAGLWTARGVSVGNAGPASAKPPSGSPLRTTLLPQSAPPPAFTYSVARSEAFARTVAGGVTGAAPSVNVTPSASAKRAGTSAPRAYDQGHNRAANDRDGLSSALAATNLGGSSCSSRDWLLQPVALGQADDQHLFELSIRLKYLDDPRVVLPALLQLYGASLVDLPVEAVVSKHDILAHLLALMTSGSVRPDLVTLAAKALTRAVTLLKRALLLATDPMLSGPGAAATAATALGGRDVGMDGRTSPGRPGGASPTEVMAQDAMEYRQQEAQRLLPQALPLAGGDVARGLEGVEVVNVSLVAYLVGLKAFQALRDPGRLFAVAPLVEELLPLLLVGRDGQGMAAVEERDRAKWAQLLQVLSQSLVANLSIARAESPPILQAPSPDSPASPQLPVLNAPSAAILILASRLLAALPPALWTPDVIPAALVDTLAAVARDDALSALLPGLRGAVLPALAVLRPDVATILGLAEAGEAALAAGAVLVRQVPLLRAGEMSPGAWLQQLHAALPALHLPDQGALLEGVMQGLALVCGSGSGSGRGGLADGEQAGAKDAAGTSRRLAWPSASSPGRPEEGDWEGHATGGAGQEYWADMEDPSATSSTAAGGKAGGGQWVAQAEDLFLQLLSHPAPAVSMASYGLLETLVQDARAQSGHPLLRLLTRQAVLERLVVLGLADQRTRRQVARILMAIMPDAACQSCMLPWSCWIRLYESDAQVGFLAAALEAAAAHRYSPPSLPGTVRSWQWLQPTLVDLFSADGEVRRAAAQSLADALRGLGTVVSTGEVYSADPLRVALDGGARDDLVVPVANPRLASSFRAADVANLLAILANAELALELRRSAAEQMLALAAEERLREVMVQEDNLRVIACVAALRDPSTGCVLSASQASALAAQGLAPPTPDLLSTLDVQLPIAAVNLLFVLAAHSPAVRAWMAAGQPASRPDHVSDPRDPDAHRWASTSGVPGPTGSGEGTQLPTTGADHGGGLGLLVEGVLPLVFHSMVTVRRAVARLLAALCFGVEADRWSGWPTVVRGAAAATTGMGTAARPSGGGPTGRAGDVLMLPEPFQKGYCFPCRVTWARLPPACCESGVLDAPGLEGLPKLQGLVSEQRELVVLLIQERQALRATGGDPAGLLALVNERPDCFASPGASAWHALAASIRAVEPGEVVGRCLAAVGAATSHGECAAALRRLQQACGTRSAVVALAGADWESHLESLLSTSPSSADDRALWVELLEPMRRVLASGALNQSQLLQLANYLQHSARGVLSAPDAAAEPPSVPVALAGSPLLPEHQPDAHGRLVCTQTVMAVLVDLIRCARTHLPVQQSLRVLLALSPTALLQTLGAAFIGNASANYGCRALAVQLLLEAAALLSSAHAVESLTLSALDAGLEEALAACFRALLQNVSGGFAAAASAAPQLAGVTSDASGGDVGSTGAAGSAAAAAAAERSRQQPPGGFAGKGSMRLALHCMLHLTALLPSSEWAPAWQQLSGSFWISRLLRDRDAVLRSLAVELLARLMQPGVDCMHAMVAQGWPDAVKTMCKVAADRGNCYALRTAALRVLCGAMTQEVPPSASTQAAPADPSGGVTPAAAEPSLPRRQLFSSLTSLPPAVLLLQNGPLWRQLPHMLQEPDAPPAFQAAALSLVLQGVLLDGERVAELLSQPGPVDKLLRFLSPVGDMLVATAAGGAGHAAAGAGWKDSGQAWAAAGLGTVARVGGAERAAVVQLLCWGQGQGRGGEGDAAGLGCVAVWEDATAALQLESLAGLGPVLECASSTMSACLPQPTTQPTDPATPRHRLHALRCAALAAQLLAHTQQDPPLLPLTPLGHSPAGVAGALLALFARMSAGVAGMDAARATQTAAQAAEGEVRLEVVRQAAAAANAVLQLMEEEALGEAVIAVDASLARAPGPLLAHCAEVLLSGRSSRRLRMAVVCLVASLLANRGTATRLLCSAPGREHLVPSTGGEVGSDLCAALVDLLPDDALIPSDHHQQQHTHAHGAAVLAGPAGLGSPQPKPRSLPPSAVRASLPALHSAQRSLIQVEMDVMPGALLAGAEGRRDPEAGMAGPGAHDTRSDNLAVIVALRNLLAYSEAAKQAALRTGYHRVLMQACARGAALLAVPAAKQAGAAGGGGGGGVERKGPQQGVGPAGPNTAKRPVPARGGRKTAPPTRNPTPAPSVTATPLAKAAHQHQHQPASEAIGEQHEQEPPTDMGTGLQLNGGAAAQLGSPQPPPRAAAVHGAQGVDHRAAARRAVEQKVVAAMSLLRHLAHNSPPARQRLVSDGLVALLRSLWPVAAAATSGPLFHELLCCVTNLLPGCAEARARMSSSSSSSSLLPPQAQEGASHEAAGPAAASGAAADADSLLSSLTALVCGAQSRLEAPTFSRAMGVLLHLTATEDGVQLLLRATTFLASCQKVLQDMAGAGGSSARQGRELPRQSALMQVLANVAAWPEGQRALLRSSSGPGLLELVIRLVAPTPDGPQPPLSRASARPPPSDPCAPSQQPSHQRELAELRNTALALLRNLAFAPESKTHLLAHPAVLPALVAAAEAVVENPRGAAYAASGLWALSYHGEKVKAALRRVPSAPQRLVAAQAACRFQLDRFKARGAGAASARGSGATERPTAEATAPGSQSATGAGEVTYEEWMERARAQLAGLLAALEATAAGSSQAEDGAGMGFPGEGRSAAAAVRYDRSPHRDQDAFRLL